MEDKSKLQAVQHIMARPRRRHSAALDRIFEYHAAAAWHGDV